jgi:hypothetical protein
MRIKYQAPYGFMLIYERKSSLIFLIDIALSKVIDHKAYANSFPHAWSVIGNTHSGQAPPRLKTQAIRTHRLSNLVNR